MVSVTLRIRLRVVSIAVAVVIATVATIATFHHAIADFFDLGLPKCGGG